MAEPTTVVVLIKTAVKIKSVLKFLCRKEFIAIPIACFLLGFVSLSMLLGQADQPDMCLGDQSQSGTTGSAPGVYQKGVDANTKVNLSIVKIAYSVWVQEKAPEAVLYAILMTGMQESHIRNYSNTSRYPITANVPGFPPDGDGSDHDSVGWLQQRPESGWGKPEELMDPAYAAGKFIDKAVKVLEDRGASLGINGGMLPDDPGAAAVAAGKLSQAVQISAFPDAYTKHWDKANSLLDIIGYEPLDPGSITSGGQCTTSGEYAVAGVREMYKYGKQNASGTVYKIAIPEGRIGAVINHALNQVDAHVPYHFGGRQCGVLDANGAAASCGSAQLDCSGLVWWSYKHAGLDWTRLNTDGQVPWILKNGTNVTNAPHLPGDVMYWANACRECSGGRDYYHTAIYLGKYKISDGVATYAPDDENAEDLIVAAPSTGDFVKIQPLHTKHRIVFWGRIWDS